MGIATLFRSTFANVDLTKFGPTHWNALRDLVTRLLDTPTDPDGYVLTRDSTSINGAKWAPGGSGGAAPSGTGYAHVTAGAWDVPAAIGEGDVANLATDLTTLTLGLAGKAAAVHTHAESDITNLTADLAAVTTAVLLRELLANKNAASGYAGLDAGSKLTGSQQVYGTAANTAAVGNDSRLSDARTPTAHATSHKSGGSDAIKLDELAAPTDVTTLNATSTQHGLQPKSPGDATKYLNGAATPAYAAIAESDVTNLTTDLAAKASLTGAQVLTNKQITPRVQAVTSSATVTPSPDTDDLVVITAQAAGLTVANPTPVVNVVQGQKLIIRIKDNGTARAISYGTQYRTLGPALPSTTVISKTLYLGLLYNSTDTKWDLVAVAQEP
jgi:hypothetical protein